MILAINKTKKEVPLERMLSDQELQVLQLLIEGHKISDISGILDISELRIAVLKNVLIIKYGVNNLISLVENIKEQNAA